MNSVLAREVKIGIIASISFANMAGFAISEKWPHAICYIIGGLFAAAVLLTLLRIRWAQDDYDELVSSYRKQEEKIRVTEQALREKTNG
jgi:TRAP-type C4-dicarboxylate transport system permease small subunit